MEHFHGNNVKAKFTFYLATQPMSQNTIKYCNFVSQKPIFHHAESTWWPWRPWIRGNIKI